MHKLRFIACLIMVMVLCLSMAAPAFADTTATPTPTATSEPTTAAISKVINPIVDLLNSLLKPLLAIVVAAGSLYCIVLGVKYAKAEEPQDREKAKQHLKNAIIGFVIIFILILAINVLKDPLIDWVNNNADRKIIT